MLVPPPALFDLGVVTDAPLGLKRLVRERLASVGRQL